MVERATVIMTPRLACVCVCALSVHVERVTRGLSMTNM